MYTRTDNPLHIIQEVLDNASDEALGGFGKQIMVTLHADGSVTLAGLYIGGGGHAAYAIPAWHLFDLNRWWQYPAGARIEPVSI